MKKRADDAERAVKLLVEIRTSIEALHDEDLLDLVDIFSGNAKTTLGEIASAQMRRRNLSL